MNKRSRFTKRQLIVGVLVALMVIGAIVGPEDVRTRLLTAALSLLTGL